MVKRLHVGVLSGPMIERSLSRLARFGGPFLVAVCALTAGCMKDDPISNESDAAAPAPKEFLKEGRPVLGPSIASEALAVGGPLVPFPTAPTDASASAPVPVKDAAPSADAAPLTGCGTKPLPDCPLQGWMHAHMEAPLAAGDADTLATSLDEATKMAPAGYTNWASIARDGAGAARASRPEAVKAACRSCHEQYKAKYKAEMRDRKI